MWNICLFRSLLVFNTVAPFKASVQRCGCKVKVLICASCVFLKVITVLSKDKGHLSNLSSRGLVCVCLIWKGVGVLGLWTRRPNVWPVVQWNYPYVLPGVWHVFVLCFRCRWVSAGRWCVSTTADLQEHFRQLCLCVSRWLCDGETPGLGAVSRCGL